ncbi:MAG: 3-hydroxyacyl-CoA dehydrogenase NAD-binding domain-containing protein [Saprospiraceae bacterium]
MTLREIKTFGILGAGTLGWKIGLQAALSGFNVLMFDISAKQLATAETFQDKLAQRLVKAGRIDQALKDAAIGRISTTDDAKLFSSQVDFVSESVTEDLDLKRRVWESFSGSPDGQQGSSDSAQGWKEHTVITTNTSYLLPSQIVDVVGDEARFCAFHFHDVFDARVVDVMGHPNTAPEVIPFLIELGKKLNQIPVHVEQETPGYLFNAMLMAYLGAAGNLLSKGKATPEAIDRSWMGNMSSTVGPFGMMDIIGLDTVDKILSVRTDRQSLAFRDVISPLVSAGKLGVKTGAGFYDYPKPTYASESFLK